MSGKLRHILISLTIPAIILGLGGCANHHKVNTQPKKIKTARQAQAIRRQHILSYSNTTANTVGGFGNKTTGGSKATKANTFVVTNGEQLHNALRKHTNHKPRKIIVDGNINASQDKQGNYLNQLSYVKRAKHTNYNFPDYLRAFNSNAKLKARQNRKLLAKARKRVADIQAQRITFSVPAKTTIIGMPGNSVKGTDFDLNHDNVIIRNLNIEAPRDEFPRWSLSQKRWIPRYSAFTTHHANNIWIDHNSMTDKPLIYNKVRHLNHRYNQHKDFIDATDGAKNVTISNNQFSNHQHVAEVNHNSTVTFAHNMFLDSTSRMPSVKNSKVDLLNNVYAGDNTEPYLFKVAWQLGKNSHVYANDNDFIFHDKGDFNKYVATTDNAKDFTFTNNNMKKNDTKAHALTKKNRKHLKSQNSFNHIIKSIQNGFGADLK